jgi:hypothetical protein
MPSPAVTAMEASGVRLGCPSSDELRVLSTFASGLVFVVPPPFVGEDPTLSHTLAESMASWYALLNVALSPARPKILFCERAATMSFGFLCFCSFSSFGSQFSSPS